jgi:hypothetical protein
MECTTDTCDVRTFRCVSDITAVCCGADTDCDDGDDCSIDFCDEFGVCDSNPDPACCDVDCNDDDPCTRDSCESDRVTCAHDPIAGCCGDDSDCRAPDVCMAGRCAAPAPDGGGAPDGAVPDGGMPPDTMEDGGCGCETPGKPSRRHLWPGLVLLALWWLRCLRLWLRRG